MNPWREKRLPDVRKLCRSPHTLERHATSKLRCVLMRGRFAGHCFANFRYVFLSSPSLNDMATQDCFGSKFDPKPCAEFLRLLGNTNSFADTCAFYAASSKYTVWRPRNFGREMFWRGIKFPTFVLTIKLYLRGLSPRAFSVAQTCREK